MADHTGVFDIDNASSNVTIVLDGNNGNISLGGHGTDGDLTLKGNDGANRITMDGQNGVVRIRSASGADIIVLGQQGNVVAGGDGLDGDLVLRDNEGKNIVTIGAGEKNFVIKDAGGTKIIEIGRNGNVVAGGGGHDGDLVLRSNDGKDRIHLDAGGGNGWFGGNGADGDVVLFPAGATDINDTGQASIHLNGDAGDIILKNADCAEDFEIVSELSQLMEPGDVMVLDDEGLVRPSEEAYDRRVVGVVSGAGECRPGIVLNRHADDIERLPLALVGRVYCKVDADLGPVAAGDLLASSPTPGHAMKANDPDRSSGSVIGKALRPLESGRGLIPILVTLQ